MLPKTFLLYDLLLFLHLLFLFAMLEQYTEQHAQQPEVPASGLSIISVSNKLIELKQKVNKLLQLMAKSKAKSPSMHITDSIDIDMSDNDDNDELDSSDDSHLIAQ